MKKLITVYFFLILGITAYDLLLDTADPVELMDVLFSFFKGLGIGTVLMAILVCVYYMCKKIFTPEHKHNK